MDGYMTVEHQKQKELVEQLNSLDLNKASQLIKKNTRNGEFNFSDNAYSKNQMLSALKEIKNKKIRQEVSNIVDPNHWSKKVIDKIRLLRIVMQLALFACGVAALILKLCRKFFITQKSLSLMIAIAYLITVVPEIYQFFKDRKYNNDQIEEAKEREEKEKEEKKKDDQQEKEKKYQASHRSLVAKKLHAQISAYLTIIDVSFALICATLALARISIFTKNIKMKTAICALAIVASSVDVFSSLLKLSVGIRTSEYRDETSKDKRNFQIFCDSLFFLFSVVALSAAVVEALEFSGRFKIFPHASAADILEVIVFGLSITLTIIPYTLSSIDSVEGVGQEAGPSL